MKKLLITLSLFAVVLPVTVAVNSNSIMPGESSQELSDLDDKFERKIKKLIRQMETQGYSVRVDQTYRSQQRQDFLYYAPRLVSQKLGLEKSGININVTSTRHSRHTRLKDGIRASCAVDLRPIGLLTTAQKADFYKTLRDSAVSMGLRSGANFEKRKSSPYYDYGLGYDPGHVDAKCK